MTALDLSPLVGTVLLDDVRVVGVARRQDAIVLLHARQDRNGAVCTVYLSTTLELRDTDTDLVASTIQRVGRYSVGIRALAAPIGAGTVRVGGVPRLFVVYPGDATATAADRIASGQPMDPGQVVRLLEPVADALGALHDQGLVHGAVIPAALQIGPVDATLSLFGWSEAASVVGGPAAARDVLPARDRSPEQVAIVPASPSQASDTYGLAILAAQLLAGKPVSTADDPAEAMRAIDNPLQRPTPRALGATVDDAVEAVFARALAVEPRERMSDPRVFIRAWKDPPAASRLPVATLGTPAPTAEPMSGTDAAPEPSARQQPVREGQPPQQPVQPGPPAFFAGPPPAPPRSGAWIVYVTVGLGVLLLIGGAGAGFYLAWTRGIHPAPPPPTASTVAAPPAPPPTTRPPRGTVPGPADPHPDAATDDEDDAGDGDLADDRDASGPPAHLWEMRPDAAVAATWPEDADALVPIGDKTPVLGTREALVTVVLFADFRCPYTRKARRLVERLVFEQGASIRIAVRLLPMPDLAGSDEAARVAAATAMTTDPYVFWHLFEAVSELDKSASVDRESLLSLAEKMGASRPLLDKTLHDRRAEALLEEDKALAGRLMVHATPTWFINGRRLNGVVPWAQLDSEVGREIVAARGTLASGTPQSKLYLVRTRFNVTAAEADRDSPQP